MTLNFSPTHFKIVIIFTNSPLQNKSKSIAQYRGTKDSPILLFGSCKYIMYW